jgi:arabinofuranan 3-O-arabinosyltransferase
MTSILIARDPLRTDFRPFYYSAEAWRTGAVSLYPDVLRPNLNPPWLAVVLSPLSMLSMRAAFLVWSAMGAAFLCASLVLIYRALQTPSSQRWWIGGAMVAAMPCAMVWGQGQVTWFVLLPVTCAWLVSRSAAVRPLSWASAASAGVFLVPAIALKPQLSLLLLFVPLSTALVAAVGVAIAGLGGVLVTGLSPWRDWLMLAQKVIWLGHPENGSVWAPIARATQGDLRGLPIFALPMAAIAAVIVLAGATWLAARRVPDVDRRWVLGTVWTTMFSPLGWIYYLPIAIGPIIASWPGNAAAVLALALLCVPIQVFWTQVHDLRSASIVAAIYPLGVMTMFLAWLWRPADSARHVRQARPGPAAFDGKS